MKITCLALIVSTAPIYSIDAIWELDLIGRSENNALTAGNEVPAIDSLARGGELSDFYPDDFGFVYNPEINELAVRLAFGATGIGYAFDLEGTFTGAHIHGPADINTSSANILHDLGTITSLQPGNRSGTISGFITLNDAEEVMLLNESLYVNIHSSVHPGGEIRANLTVIPEPSTYGVAGGLALLAFAGFRRWKTQQTA